MRRRGFGYAINYDREIERDRKELAHLERARDLGLVSVDPMWLPELVIANEAVAERLNLSLEDRQALADVCDYTDADFARAGLALPQLNSDGSGVWYRRGGAVADQLAELWDGCLASPAGLKKAIAQTKARLARHIRNRGAGR